MIVFAIFDIWGIDIYMKVFPVLDLCTQMISRINGFKKNSKVDIKDENMLIDPKTGFT